MSFFFDTIGVLLLEMGMLVLLLGGSAPYSVATVRWHLSCRMLCELISMIGGWCSRQKKILRHRPSYQRSRHDVVWCQNYPASKGADQLCFFWLEEHYDNDPAYAPFPSRSMTCGMEALPLWTSHSELNLRTRSPQTVDAPVPPAVIEIIVLVVWILPRTWRHQRIRNSGMVIVVVERSTD